MRHYFILFFMFITLNAFAPTFTLEQRKQMEKEYKISTIQTVEEDVDLQDYKYIKKLQISTFSKNDRKKCRRIAKEHKIETKDLYKLIYLESKGKPWIVNPYSGATGLIQFLPSTAKALGTDTCELKYMNVSQQLDYVDKYLTIQLQGKKIRNFTDLYLTIFRPSAIGQHDEYIISEKYDKKKNIGDISNQNPAFRDSSGKVTIKSIKRFITLLNI